MQGHLVIADISGYTRFLTESELEHANGIIEDLLNAVIGSIHAPLTVSSIEGDAIFLYGTMPEGTIGQAVVDGVERLYTSFAAALETMVLNTTCQCNACANINALGLKIVMHCGEFVISNVAGRESLSGPDVILVHRLLKNHVTERTGIDDYLLVTEACVEDLGIEGMVAGWKHHDEEYEHVGEIKGYVTSLKDVWEFTRSQSQVKILQRDAWFSAEAHSSAPVGVLWDFMVDPVKRTEWIGVNDTELQGVEDGRIGPGTEYHCAHGEHNDIAIIAILDMKPLDYMTLTAQIGPGIAMNWTDYVIPSGDGSRVISYAARPYYAESGETLPDDLLEEKLAELAAGYQTQAGVLTDMASRAALAVSPG